MSYQIVMVAIMENLDYTISAQNLSIDNFRAFYNIDGIFFLSQISTPTYDNHFHKY